MNTMAVTFAKLMAKFAFFFNENLQNLPEIPSPNLRLNKIYKC